jgi:hypothetical protein
MIKITKLPNGGELWEYPHGLKCWCINDKLHREDGPAIEHTNGDKYWFINGKYHREDGPAFESPNGNKYWYINGERILCTTQKEFKRLLRLKGFW